jgi:hypothetical protein
MGRPMRCWAHSTLAAAVIALAAMSSIKALALAWKLSGVTIDIE